LSAENPIVIPTERDTVVLREPSDHFDDLAFFDAYNASRTELEEFYTIFKGQHSTIIGPAEYRRLAPLKHETLLNIWDSEVFVGHVHFWPSRLKHSRPTAEMGYWCDTRYTRYATSQAGYAQVRAYPDARNIGSVRVLEKSGFKQSRPRSGSLVFVFDPADYSGQ
jgi:RimJ/RimL family protein N-acetyltransferase